MAATWRILIDAVGRLHQENDNFLLAQKYRQPGRIDERKRLAFQSECIVAARCRAMEYSVAHTTRNAPFDLWVAGVRVEVKASKYYPASHGGGRYQAYIHHSNADVLIFDCVNGNHHFFVFPMAALARRRNIAIWRHDPTHYVGEWMTYLEAWEYLTEAIDAARRSWQPPLFTL